MAKDKVYFIGGSQGVGKSTLINEVVERTGLDVIHAGTFFKYQNNDIPHFSRPVLIGNMLNALEHCSDVILDTHYTHKIEKVNGSHTVEFIRGLETYDLIQLSSYKDMEFALIGLDPQTLLNRRECDLTRDRECNILNVEKELYHERRVFEEYHLQMNKFGTVINNYDLEMSIDDLVKFVSK